MIRPTSIKTKMLLLVLGMMLVTAAVLISHTREDIGGKLLELEERSVRNMIYLIKLNVENQYKSLLFHKLTALAARKNKMKDLALVAQAGLRSHYEMYRDGLLSEEDAKQRALAWVKGLTFGKELSFWLYDEKYTVLAHTNQELIGAGMEELKDAKGVGLFRSMQEKAKSEGEGYATFSWAQSAGSSGPKVLGYFTAFPGWNWMVGTSIDIEDIESEAQKKLTAILGELKETFSKVKIAQTGYLFLFNGKREILIPGRASSEELLKALDPGTGRPMIDEMMRASQTPETPLEYMWKDASSGEASSPHESYVDYFKTLDWYIASSARKDEIQLPAQRFVMRQTLFISLIFAVSIMITYLLVSRLSKHLKDLTEYAKELPSHDFAAPPDAVSTLELLRNRYRDEVGKLAEAFLFMEASLRQYIKDLRETMAAKERIESDLRIAREIQMSIVPKIFPPFPERHELDIHAVLRPAKEVGGDFYNFFFVDDQHLFFTIGDVSGKGTPASLFMAVAQTLLRATVGSDCRLEHVMAHVNSKLCEGNDNCMFVTVFCGILDVKTGDVLCANGGHNPSVHVTGENEAHFVELPAGMALGVMEEMGYRIGTIRLKPGDLLFMYTDGVTEATNIDNELFSEERLKKDIMELSSLTPQEVVQQMIARIDAFAGEAPQADDITMVALRYMG